MIARRSRPRDPTPAARLRRLLLRWYDTNRRDLPWRRSSDPYAIWISETMLQQTRVETVVPYYERFLQRFPDVEALATADEEEVTGLWAGLGYYSRARNLHAAAKAVQREHSGHFPSEAAALRKLPGIGRYTAGALASIAFDRREAVVDGNVIRVLARVRGIRDDVATTNIQERFWQEAASLADGARPGDLNQALMELGAMICTARKPRCLTCPLRPHCDAHAAGDAEALPLKRPKKPPLPIEATGVWLARRGKVLAVRRPRSGLMAGMWELPGGDLLAGEAPEQGLRRSLRERLGLALKRADYVGTVVHAFSHRRLRLHVFGGGTASGRVRLDGPSEHRWLATDTAGAFASVPHGAAVRKALEVLARAKRGQLPPQSR